MTENRPENQSTGKADFGYDFFGTELYKTKNPASSPVITLGEDTPGRPYLRLRVDPAGKATMTTMTTAQQTTMTTFSHV